MGRNQIATISLPFRYLCEREPPRIVRGVKRMGPLDRTGRTLRREPPDRENLNNRMMVLLHRLGRLVRTHTAPTPTDRTARD